MTLKLIADNTVELEVYNFQDIAGCARRYADQLEAGEQGKPHRLVVVAQSDDGLSISLWGDNTSAHELMGMLEAAKLTVFANDAMGDD